jgi:hypothetical protein
MASEGSAEIDLATGQGGTPALCPLMKIRLATRIVRIYFGSRPTRALRAQAQRALNQLRLPSKR